MSSLRRLSAFAPKQFGPLNQGVPSIPGSPLPANYSLPVTPSGNGGYLPLWDIRTSNPAANQYNPLLLAIPSSSVLKGREFHITACGSFTTPVIGAQAFNFSISMWLPGNPFVLDAAVDLYNGGIPVDALISPVTTPWPFWMDVRVIYDIDGGIIQSVGEVLGGTLYSPVQPYTAATAPFKPNTIYPATVAGAGPFTAQADPLFEAAFWANFTVANVGNSVFFRDFAVEF